jgi:hypothetical protein
LAVEYKFDYGQEYKPALNRADYFWTRKYFVEPERQKQRMFIEELVTIEDADKEYGGRQAMEKPAKPKSGT